VEVPALPRCFLQGETIDEALTNVRETIELHLEDLKAEGQEIPRDGGFIIGKVEVSVTP